MENTLAVNEELTDQQVEADDEVDDFGFHDAQLSIFPTVEDRIVVLSRLKLLGATLVEITFSGGGDSGEIEDATVFSGSGSDQIDISSEVIRGWGHKSVHTPDKGWVEEFKYTDGMFLGDLLKELAQDALEKSGHDWYNNDGGQGTFTIDFKESPPVISLNVGVNYTETSEHEYNL